MGRVSGVGAVACEPTLDMGGVHPTYRGIPSPGVKNGGAEDPRALFLMPWGHVGDIFSRSVFRCVFQLIVLAFWLPKWCHN